MHINKHLAVIQADTHTHRNRCHLIVGPVETLEHLLYIILIQADTRVRYRYLNVIMERSLLVIIGPHLNVHLDLTLIVGVFECV